jgi:predicted GIY-YIG superfamily endonuclease
MSQKLPEPGASNSPPKGKPYWVYVIQSQQVRVGKRGNPLPGFHYVGMTTDPKRRLRQHNGEIKGGGRYTSKHRPWILRAIWGPFPERSSALKAERALKKGKRGSARCHWTPEDSRWCPPWPNQGTRHPWLSDPTWKPDPKGPTWRGGTSDPSATPSPRVQAGLPGGPE